MIPYVISGKDDSPTQTLTFFAKSEQHTVARSHQYFGQIKDILVHADACIRNEADLDELIALSRPIVIVEKAVAKTVRAQRLDPGTVEVRDGQVFFDGEAVHGHLVDRILEIALVGSVAPWVAFMTNLMQNPSFVAQKELYLWLEKAHLPVTPDGHFLAYKKVSEEFLDLHTRTLDYSPGKIVEMPRHKVDDDRNNLCSSGLHFCSAAYLPHFGSSEGNKVVLVKINPADVVSIPSDYDDAKGRAWRIEVIEDVTETFAAIAWPPVATNTREFGVIDDAEYEGYEYYDDDDDYDEGCDDDSCPDCYPDTVAVDWSAGIDDDEYADDVYDFEVDVPPSDRFDADINDYEGPFSCGQEGCDCMSGITDPEQAAAYLVTLRRLEAELDGELAPSDLLAKVAAAGLTPSQVLDTFARPAYETELLSDVYPHGYTQDNWDVRYVDADVYDQLPPEDGSFEPFGFGL